MPIVNSTISGALGLGQPPLATVLLGHELPDGSDHIDWMVARDSKNARPLVSFHLARPLQTLGEGQAAAAERIHDHRPIYLQYEGEIAGDRGRVRQVQRGTITRWADAPPDQLELAIQWPLHGGENLVQHLLLRAENPSHWLVKCVSMRRC